LPDSFEQIQIIRRLLAIAAVRIKESRRLRVECFNVSKAKTPGALGLGKE
jgi:hypothetical protein